MKHLAEIFALKLLWALHFYLFNVKLDEQHCMYFVAE